MTLRIIFLDLDGVLNHGAGPWLPQNVRELNRITDLTGAKIVVHSLRRFGKSLEDMSQDLERAGVTGEVLDLAPVPSWVQQSSGIIVLDQEDLSDFMEGRPTKWANQRPASIQAWLNRHPEVCRTDFVILDDTQTMGDLKDCFIRIDANTGLTREDADEAIRRLKGVTW